MIQSSSKNIQFSVIRTSSGDDTLKNSLIDETYHSKHGAITESQHIFIQNGLMSLNPQSGQIIRITEFGFGSGLNAFLTLLAARDLQISIHYTGLEKYILPNSIAQTLTYPELLNANKSLFLRLHQQKNEIPVPLTPYFTFTLKEVDFLEANLPQKTHLIYFDAFSPDKQPELWSVNLFKKIYHSLVPGGILITYSAKGLVKRHLREAGFTVVRLNGPPGKRHILRALK